jgi:hypothetical protein
MRCNINVLDILKIRLNTFFISEHIFENRYSKEMTGAGSKAGTLSALNC